MLINNFHTLFYQTQTATTGRVVDLHQVAGPSGVFPCVASFSEIIGDESLRSNTFDVSMEVADLPINKMLESHEESGKNPSGSIYLEKNCLWDEFLPPVLQ